MSVAREIPLNRGMVSIVDEADFDWLNQWKWYATYSPCNKSYYAVRMSSRSNGPRRMIQMHRLILGLEPKDKQQGDHKNRVTLDNRRENLRVATASQNGANKVRQSHNTSGFKGVAWSSDHGKWRAYIKDVQTRKYIHLGYFVRPEDAHSAYKSAAIEKFGEFARFE